MAFRAWEWAVLSVEVSSPERLMTLLPGCMVDRTPMTLDTFFSEHRVL